MANSADPDQLIWIYTVCKGRVYPGSAEQGLIGSPDKMLAIIKDIFCYFCSRTYLVGTHWNRLAKAIPMNIIRYVSVQK